MATTRQEIQDWLTSHNDGSHSHLIVVCDTYDWVDYPVPVKVTENVHEKVKAHDNVNMQRVEEVYSYALPLEEQLQERRAFNY